MLAPHDPSKYRNHGEEVQDALQQWYRNKEAFARQARIYWWCDVAKRTLGLIIWAAAALVIALMLIGLFRFAIDRAEAMPRYIEGVE